MRKMACAFALAAGTGMAGGGIAPVLATPLPVAAEAGLQVNIVPPGTVAGDAEIPLDVRFRGGNIRVIELFVDGTRLTRQAISTRDGRGLVHFSLDPSLLEMGSHELLVKAYEADGTCATTTTQIMVAGAELNSLVRFEWPRRNAEVQGIIPIKIKIDPSVVEPYVMYTIDNEFIAFRNYAPYVYNWDSSKVDNGAHAIGIEVLDGKTLQVVQKMTLAINVKNLGGFTKIHAPESARTDSASVLPGSAENALPSSVPAIRDSVLEIARSSETASFKPSRMVAAAGLRSNLPLRNALRRTETRTVLPLLAAPIAPSLFDGTNLSLRRTAIRHSPAATAFSAASVERLSATAGAVHVAPGLEALAAVPSDLMPKANRPMLGLARQTARFRRTGGIALRPGTNRLVPHTVPSRPIRPLPTFAGAKRKSFDVAFNNTIINFDVAPRVENGLPLAPFRAIFEHSGGTVKWYNDAKTLRAFDNEREIEVTVGSREAKVNNQLVSMEATPYIENGRTIVPLSFVRDSMNLKVTFDRETGHLMIERK